MSDSDSILDKTGAKFSRFEEMSPNSKSFYMRTFGKMEAGALRGAIFTLISTAIGAGCLTLPQILDKQGIIVGILLIVFACFLAYEGIINLSNASESFKTYDYSDLVHKVLGYKWKILFDNTLILYVFGTLIGYQVMIGKFVPDIFQSLDISFNSSIERYVLMIAFNFAIMTPLALMKTLTSLRFMSIVSVLTLLYIALLVISEFPFYAKYNNYNDSIEWFRVDLSILPSFNICMYSFTCHTNVSQVYDELNNRNLRRMKKVAFRAMTAVLMPFILLAMFGYLSKLGDTPDLFIQRDPPRDISNDWLMVVARVMMSITLVIAVPINTPACRNVIIKSWLKIKTEPSNKV
jgi:amino acid permease